MSDADVRGQVIRFKRQLAPNREALKRAFADVKDRVRRATDIILRDVAAGRPVVPCSRTVRSGMTTSRKESRATVENLTDLGRAQMGF